MKTLWLILGLALAFAAPASAEDFDAGQSAAQAQNRAGLTCMLSLPDGKTQFQQGEIIHLTLSFTSDRMGAYRMQRWSFGHMDSLHVFPSEGTVDPMADVPPPKFFSYEGPPPPVPVPIGNKPVEVPLTVNEWLRFDKPGTYRIYVTSTRVVDGKVKRNDLFDDGKTIAAASNTVQFQIIPANPVWAHAQAQGALAEVQSHYQGPLTVTAPWDVLRFLGTPESAQALLSVMAMDKYPRSSESPGRQCRLGLIGYPNRAWLLGEMERDLAAPDYTVTQPFLETLAEIGAYRQKAKDDGPMLRAYWLRAAQAALGKTGATRPMTLHTLLEEAWQTPDLGQDSAVQAYMPSLTRHLALDFDQLPPLPQSYLLGDEWARFRTPALLPALRRLWAGAKLTDNTSEFDPNNAELNGLILRRLADLSPQEGRMLILKEAASLNPRAEIDALVSLPDKTLPSLDRTLARHLAACQNIDLTCQLVARYATDTVLPQAQAYYAKPQDGATEVSLLAYFLRVRPDYGRLMLHKALLHWLGRGSMETLMGEVADVYYGPALEQSAVAGLQNPDPGVVADAARTLGRHGSPKVEPALWARLQTLETTRRSRAVVEAGLAASLATGQSWYESPARLKQIRALCVTDEGRQPLDDCIQRLGTGKVHVDYEMGNVGYWSVGQYNGKGRTAFFAKLAQFPKSAVFSWQDIGFGPDEERLYAQAQAATRTHGQELEREHPRSLPE